MAMRCGLFDSTEVVDRVGGFPVGNKAQTADFFARYFAAFVGSGVCGKEEDGFLVVPAGGLTVQVMPGEAFLQGYFCFEDEVQETTFDYSGSEREMTLVLRLDTEVGEIAAKWLPRSQSVNLPLRGNGYYDLVIAKVFLSAGCEEITSDMIVDLRGEENMCGFVRTLAYGGAEKLAKSFVLELAEGCEGFARIDGAADVTLFVDAVNMEHAAGVLPIAQGGTGGTSAAAARLNLGAAALLHDTYPEELLPGELGTGVVAANGVDAAGRLRNFAVYETLPDSLPDGCFCAVYGEAERGLYLFRSGAAIKIAGV